MKEPINLFPFVTAMLFVNSAAAEDPVPYPGVGNGSGGGKVEVNDDVKVDPASGSNSGTTKGTFAWGRKTHAENGKS